MLSPEGKEPDEPRSLTRIVPEALCWPAGTLGTGR